MLSPPPPISMLYVYLVRSVFAWKAETTIIVRRLNYKNLTWKDRIQLIVQPPRPPQHSMIYVYWKEVSLLEKLRQLQ